MVSVTTTEAAVKVYTGRLLCRTAATATARHTIMALSAESEAEDIDSMYCNDGAMPQDEGIKTDESGIQGDNTPTSPSSAKALQKRLVASLRGGWTYMEDKIDAFDTATESFTHQVEENFKLKAASLSESKTKAVDAMSKSKVSAEERAIRHSKQLEEKFAFMDEKTRPAQEVVNSKIAFIKEKARPTYVALDTSATRYSQQLEGLVSQQTATVADKTKAAATLVHTKSGELMSSARTKSQELATNTKGKLQAVGQSGFRVLTRGFQRGGA